MAVKIVLAMVVSLLSCPGPAGNLSGIEGRA